MNNVNGIQNRMNNELNKNNNELPRDLAMLNKIYSDFYEKMNKSDFSNSSRRYIVELEYVKNLKEKSNNYKLDNEVKKWEQREAEIRKKLGDMGIKVN